MGMRWCDDNDDDGEVRFGMERVSDEVNNGRGGGGDGGGSERSRIKSITMGRTDEPTDRQTDGENLYD